MERWVSLVQREIQECLEFREGWEKKEAREKLVFPELVHLDLLVYQE